MRGNGDVDVYKRQGVHCGNQIGNCVLPFFGAVNTVGIAVFEDDRKPGLCVIDQLVRSGCGEHALSLIHIVVFLEMVGLVLFASASGPQLSIERAADSIATGSATVSSLVTEVPSERTEV